MSFYRYIDSFFLHRFDGKFELTKKGQELRIENSSPRDQGNYTCVALANDAPVSITRSFKVRKHRGIFSERLLLLFWHSPSFKQNSIIHH